MTGAFAVLAGLLALIDPRLRILVWAALGLAVISFARDRGRVYLPALALCLAVPCGTGFTIGADSLNYMAYTSSILSDHDLDLENQFGRLGIAVSSRTPTGLVPNVLHVGPGLIWLPAVALTHLWLSWTGAPVDRLFLSTPYYAAAAATTIALLLASALMLSRTLSKRFGEVASSVAVLSIVFTSPVLYYVAVQPLMSHALTFAFAAFCLAFTLRAEQSEALSPWAWCGASVGLAMLCRPQAVPLALLVVAGLWRARAGFKPALLAATGCFLVFLPQAIAWKVLYGSFVTIPQGDGFIDWTGRHSLDVLLSADRGLFNWHPTLLLGFLGLAFCMQGLRAYALASMAIFGFTTFLNGSVRDWNGSGAFGGRRFDLVMPLFTLGLAALLSRVRPFLSRSPMALPAAAMLTAALWNISLIDVLSGRPARALPLDELARLQTGQARRAADATVGRVGPFARDLIYRVFVGLFAYDNYRPGGDFDLATLEPRFVRPGWSDVQWWGDGTSFRYLLFPRGCIVIPLNEPFDLRGVVRARAPSRIDGQRLTLSVNGHPVAEAELPAAWTDVPFAAPRRLWQRGENEFCVSASKKRPGDEGDDLAFAAAVARVQLP